MANTYYVSELSAEQIERALEAISDVVSASNNGKVLCITDGVIDAKSASTWSESAVLEPGSATANGDYTPPAGVDGFSSFHVDVQGGGGSANIQPLSVTQNGTYNPPSGVDGFAPVTVSVSDGGSSKPTIPADFQEVEYLGFTGTQYAIAPVIIQQFQLFGVQAMIGESASQVEQDLISFDSSSSIYFQNSYVTCYGNLQHMPISPADLPITRNVEFCYYAYCNITRNTNLLIGRYRTSGDAHPIEDGRIYGIRITQLWEGDIELSFESAYWFIPCVRKSDQVAGFYEAIGGNFYTNQGTGDFVVGPAVNA